MIVLRDRFVRIAVQSRRDADDAASPDIAAIHNGVAAVAQAKANTLSVALRTQHMAVAS